MVNYEDTLVASVPASAATLETVRTNFDVFTKNGAKDVAIFDSFGHSPLEGPLAKLAETLGADADELMGTLIMIYHDSALDAKN